MGGLLAIPLAFVSDYLIHATVPNAYSLGGAALRKIAPSWDRVAALADRLRENPRPEGKKMSQKKIIQTCITVLEEHMEQWELSQESK